MPFREKLIALRARDHLTQSALANAVGVTRQSVYMWEKGQSYPEAETLLALRRLFGVSIDALLDDGILLSDLQAPPAQSARAAGVQPPKATASTKRQTAGKEDKLTENAPATDRFSKEEGKTPAKTVENADVKESAHEPSRESREPLRAKVAPTREKKNGNILDLLGAFWKKKK